MPKASLIHKFGNDSLKQMTGPACIDDSKPQGWS